MFSRIRNFFSSIYTSATLSLGSGAIGSNNEHDLKRSMTADKSRPFYSRLIRRNKYRPKLRMDNWTSAI